MFLLKYMGIWLSVFPDGKTQAIYQLKCATFCAKKTQGKNCKHGEISPQPERGHPWGDECCQFYLVRIVKKVYLHVNGN